MYTCANVIVVEQKNNTHYTVTKARTHLRVGHTQ